MKFDGNHNYRCNARPFKKALTAIERENLRADGTPNFDKNTNKRILAKRIGLESKTLSVINHLLNGEPVSHLNAAVAHAWKPRNQVEAIAKKGNHRPPTPFALEAIKRRGFVRYGIVPLPGLIDDPDALPSLTYFLESLLRRKGITRFQAKLVSNADAQIGLHRDLDFVFGGSSVHECSPERQHPWLMVPFGLLTTANAQISAGDSIEFIGGSPEEAIIRSAVCPKNVFEARSLLDRAEQYSRLFERVKTGKCFAALAPAHVLAFWMVQQHSIGRGQPVLGVGGTTLDFLDSGRLHSWLKSNLPEWDFLATKALTLYLQVNQRSGLKKTEDLSNCLSQFRRNQPFMNAFLDFRGLIEASHQVPGIAHESLLSKEIKALDVKFSRFHELPSQYVTRVFNPQNVKLFDGAFCEAGSVRYIDYVLKEMRCFWRVSKTQIRVHVIRKGPLPLKWADTKTAILRNLERAFCVPDHGVGVVFPYGSRVINTLAIEPKGEMVRWPEWTRRRPHWQL